MQQLLTFCGGSSCGEHFPSRNCAECAPVFPLGVAERNTKITVSGFHYRTEGSDFLLDSLTSTADSGQHSDECSDPPPIRSGPGSAKWSPLGHLPHYSDLPPPVWSSWSNFRHHTFTLPWDFSRKQIFQQSRTNGVSTTNTFSTVPHSFFPSNNDDDDWTCTWLPSRVTQRQKTFAQAALRLLCHQTKPAEECSKRSEHTRKKKENIYVWWAVAPALLMGRRGKLLLGGARSHKETSRRRQRSELEKEQQKTATKTSSRWQWQRVRLVAIKCVCDKKLPRGNNLKIHWAKASTLRRTTNL